MLKGASFDLTVPMATAIGSGVTPTPVLSISGKRKTSNHGELCSNRGGVISMRASMGRDKRLFTRYLMLCHLRKKTRCQASIGIMRNCPFIVFSRRVDKVRGRSKIFMSVR